MKLPLISQSATKEQDSTDGTPIKQNAKCLIGEPQSGRQKKGNVTILNIFKNVQRMKRKYDDEEANKKKM